MSLKFAAPASRLYLYPSDRFAVELSELERSLVPCPTAGSELHRFASHVHDFSLKDLRELYTRTFDLTPVCAPYLSVHLFGESSFKRAQLMTGLREAYATCGVRFDDELPDHLAVVLAAFDRLQPEVQRDLVSLCLMAALPKMQSELERQHNPYAHAIASLRICVCGWKAPEEVLCA